MEIVKYPDDKLREISEEVKFPLSEDDKHLLNEMYRFVKNPDNNAVGLSAIQVGVSKRMCAIKYDDVAFKLVNPKIISHSTTKTFDTEGCLSVVPDREDILVPRWKEVRVIAFDLISNKNVCFTARGFLARAIQHEIDHMNGKLYIDYAENNEDKTASEA